MEVNPFAQLCLAFVFGTLPVISILVLAALLKYLNW